MRKTIRIGVAGLGFGASVHVPAFQSLPGVRVVALVGSRIEKAKEIAKKFGVEKAYSGWKELLKQPLDAVSFALPPLENEKAVLEAIKRGIPVLCEKPLATSAAEAHHLAKAAAGKIAMVDFEFIEIPGFQKLKKIITQRTYGKLRHAQITWLVESWAHQNKKWSWKTDAEQGGGVITLLGSHFFFLIEWLIGSINALSARLSSKATKMFCPPGSIAAEDLAQIWLTLKGDIPVSATIGNASPGFIGQRWEMIFDRATVILSNPGPSHLTGFRIVVKKYGKEKVLFSEKSKKGSADGFVAFRGIASRFVQAVREGKGKLFPDFASAARVQNFMEQTYQTASRPKP